MPTYGFDTGSARLYVGRMERKPNRSPTLTSLVKLATVASDPPRLSAAEIQRIAGEAHAAGEEFSNRTASMEMLTVDDLRVRAK